MADASPPLCIVSSSVGSVSGVSARRLFKSFSKLARSASSSSARAGGGVCVDGCAVDCDGERADSGGEGGVGEG